MRALRRPLAVVAAALAALLAVAQLALPRLAERALRDRLDGAPAAEVAVRAVPAVKLLWRHADRVTVRAPALDAVDLDIAEELAQAHGIARLDVAVAHVRGPAGLVVRDLRLAKRRERITATAVVDGRDLARTLPSSVAVRLVPGSAGTITVEGRIAGLSARAHVVARDGRVVLRPAGLIGVFAAVTLFDDDRIAVEELAAVPLGADRHLVSARARFA